MCGWGGGEWAENNIMVTLSSECSMTENLALNT